MLIIVLNISILTQMLIIVLNISFFTMIMVIVLTISFLTKNTVNCVEHFISDRDANIKVEQPIVHKYCKLY